MPLPFIDEQSLEVAAAQEAVWDSALATFVATGDNPAAAAFARVLGCDPATASAAGGEIVGRTVPGFRVVRAERPDLLVLAGRHRFARYEIVVRIEATHEGSRCTLESRAAFPGPHGWLYRQLVIGTSAHVRAVRRLLHRIERAARD